MERASFENDINASHLHIYADANEDNMNGGAQRGIDDHPYSWYINVCNLPDLVDQETVKNLVESIIETESNYAEGPFNDFSVVEFGEGDRDGDKSQFATIELYSYETTSNLVEILNGYEWKGKILDIKFPEGGGDYLDDPNIALYDGYYTGELPQGQHGPLNHSYSRPIQQHARSGQQQRQTLNLGDNKRQSTRKSKSVYSPLKPLPPFIMNMAGQNSTNLSDQSPTSSVREDESGLPPTSDFITVKNDEGQTIKVNPCRLFVGNIPFLSTWPSLKNFLITKAEELEPGNNIEILRVEIPMQLLVSQPGSESSGSNSTSSSSSNISLASNVNLKKLNSYQFLSSFANNKTSETMLQSRGLSRGFAIVTTGNKDSLEKLIKYFDNVDFEGRPLTVRYDKFPDFNNYILQQLNPSSGNNKMMSKRSMMTNLAFERNMFQHRFYYGNHTQMPHMSNGMVPYPYYYTNSMYPVPYYGPHQTYQASVPPTPQYLYPFGKFHGGDLHYPYYGYQDQKQYIPKSSGQNVPRIKHQAENNLPPEKVPIVSGNAKVPEKGSDEITSTFAAMRL